MNLEACCLDWNEEIIPHGWSIVAFKAGKAVAKYVQSGKAGFAESKPGKGKVFSFGSEP